MDRLERISYFGWARGFPSATEAFPSATEAFPLGGSHVVSSPETACRPSHTSELPIRRWMSVRQGRAAGGAHEDQG